MDIGNYPAYPAMHLLCLFLLFMAVVLVALCFVAAIAAGYALTRWQRRHRARSSGMDQYQPPPPHTDAPKAP